MQQQQFSVNLVRYKKIDFLVFVGGALVGFVPIIYLTEVHALHEWRLAIIPVGVALIVLGIWLYLKRRVHKTLISVLPDRVLIDEDYTGHPAEVLFAQVAALHYHTSDGRFNLRFELLSGPAVLLHADVTFGGTVEFEKMVECVKLTDRHYQFRYPNSPASLARKAAAQKVAG